MTAEVVAQISNRYTLHEQLGEGAMGIVYRATDCLTGNTVALKRVQITPKNLLFASRASETDPLSIRLALAQEFRTLATIRHPNIISVLDYGFDQNRQPFFTMELLENTQTILEVREAIPMEAGVGLVIELLQALSYLHRRAILHRDLKPANILVTRSEKVRVLDFGLSTTLAQAKSAGGTLAYMAPEMLRDRSASPASDLFAVGIIAYQLLTGQYPFPTQNPTRLMASILHQEPDYGAIANPALAKVVQTCLAKDPSQRYPTAEAVITALSAAIHQPAPPESSAIRESFLQAAAFVGREAELNQLGAALNQMIQGGGSTWLIGGESGVGKSRLVDELRTQALVEGIQVLRGQGVEGAGLPYHLWREPLRLLALSSDLSDREAGILKTIVPDIENLLNREIPEVPHLEGQAQQQRLMATLTQMFQRQDRPVLLLLEDLQWADESLEPLKRLNPLVSDLPLMIVANYRNDERPDLPEILPHMRTLTLRRFSKDETAQIARSMIGEAGQQPTVVSHLQAETEGNVFFLVEVVRALAEEAGNLNAIGHDTLPEHIITGGIQHILQRRLGKIPSVYQPLLKQAAIIGRDIDLHLLEHLKQGIDLEEWLTVGHQAAVFDVQDNRWRFAHDKLREQVLVDISVEEHPVLYRQVAEAVEAEYAEDDAWAEVLLYLWRAVGDETKELVYLERLVNHLVRYTADYDRVHALILYGLAHLDDNDKRRVSLLNHRSQYLWRMGDYAAAHADVIEALTLAERHHDQKGAAASLNNLGNVAYYAGEYEAAISYYQRSVELFRVLGNHWDAALNLQNIGWTFSYVGDYTQAVDYVEEGNAIFTAIDKSWGIANGTFILAVIATHQGHYEQAVDYHKQSLAYYYTSGEPWSTVLNLTNLSFVYLAQGQAQEAAATLVETLTLSRNAGLTGSVLETIVGFAHLFFNDGQQVRAAQLIGMVQTHASLNSEIQTRLDGMMPLLEEAFSLADLRIAMEQGKTLDLDTVVQELLQMFI